MRPKTQFHILSLVTLLVFPAIGLTLLWFFEDVELISVFELDRFFNPLTLIGLEFGFLYGFIVIGVSQFPIFEELSRPQTQMIKNLKLNWVDIIFMSFCAGFGERSEEHTSELQSRPHLVCRLLLEKKKIHILTNFFP